LASHWRIELLSLRRMKKAKRKSTAEKHFGHRRKSGVHPISHRATELLRGCHAHVAHIFQALDSNTPADFARFPRNKP